MLTLNSNAMKTLRAEISQAPNQYFSRLQAGELLKPVEYELLVETTRDARIQWWREARFGIFITYGLYSGRGKGEWEFVFDGVSKEEYEKTAEHFDYQSGAALEWVRLAKKAGAKYIVFTTRHHEGFSLWDSKVNPYNSVNYGPHIDIVREFTDACRAEGIKIGLYTSIMDWHNPDSGASIYDLAARERFARYICALNEELLTNYGKIDILWYDGNVDCIDWSFMNQRMRGLQPDIIINDRAGIYEDFGTPEGHLEASERDWETCEPITEIVSWSYMDPKQATPYVKNAHKIINHLSYAARNCGNILLNIAPYSDGTVSDMETNILTEVGQWLDINGEAIYGSRLPCRGWGGFCSLGLYGGNMLSTCTAKDNRVYLLQLIWPSDGMIRIGGYNAPPKSVYILADHTPLEFSYTDFCITIENLPKESPDPLMNIPVVVLEFEDAIAPYSYGRGCQEMNQGFTT